MYVCMYACMYVCIYIHTYILRTCTHIHTIYVFLDLGTRAAGGALRPSSHHGGKLRTGTRTHTTLEWPRKRIAKKSARGLLVSADDSPGTPRNAVWPQVHATHRRPPRLWRGRCSRRLL